MSTKYFLRDVEALAAYASFNRQLEDVCKQCLDLVSGMSVDPRLERLKDELLFDLKYSDMFSEREPYVRSFEIGSASDKCFYWMDHKGFDGLDSVQNFMKKNPHLVIVDDSGDNKAISFAEFEGVVSPKEKKQIGIWSGKEILKDSDLDSLIHNAESKKVPFFKGHKRRTKLEHR